mgnify:CR=1 FL=1
MNREYMGQVTEKDIELVNLLILHPDLALEKIGAMLGISKQAVAERKSRLEEQGFTKLFYFWNIAPRFESTIRLTAPVRNPDAMVGPMLQILDKFNPVVAFFRTNPQGFFDGTFSSLSSTISEIEAILNINDEADLVDLRAQLRDIGVSDFSLEPILFSRLLGEKCDITRRTPEDIRAIAEESSRDFSSQPSTKAVLYEEAKHATDQFDMVIIRDARLQPNPDSFERRVSNVLIDYHFLSMEDFLKIEHDWSKELQVLYAEGDRLRTELERKIKSL